MSAAIPSAQSQSWQCGSSPGLRQQGFRVDWVRDGEAAQRQLRARFPAFGGLRVEVSFAELHVDADQRPEVVRR
ncbi:hypothetical protein PWR63_35120 [Paraburkholderia sp. A2WS-5]|uniref:hypothetical protein n=1 Tax=unclassified Paraburkholderia TaxID=2615204 RepID=UPI003B79CC41